MNRARRRALLLAPLLALALLAAGCRNDNNQFKIGENDTNPVDRGSVPTGGTLNWAITQLPSNYNFNQIEGARSDEDAVISALMPSTFVFQASAEPVPNRDYVTSAQLTATSPQQVVTYEINPKAAWEDGTPITETDFESQWRALNGTNAGYKAAFTQGYDQIGAVTQGKDPREVVVTFRNPYTDWRALFSPLYPASANKDPKTFNEGWISKPPTTAGPFTFQGFDASAQTLTLVRSKTWWGQPAKLDSIIFHAFGGDTNTELDALSKGKVDFVNIPPDEGQLRAARAIKGVTIRRAGGPDFRQVTMNGAGPTLQDVTVRKALGLAIDRTRIAKALLDPLGVPDARLDNHIYMTNQRGYRDNSGDLTTADPKQAVALLDRAGWKLSGSGGTRSRNGQPLEIRLVIPSKVPAAAREAALIKTMLKGVGADVTVQTVPGIQFITGYILSGDFDLALFSWQGTPFPITSNLPIYRNPTKAPSGQLVIHQNYARVGSPELDQLFARALAELDPNAATRLGNEIDAKIWQEVHSLTLYQRPQIVATKSNLANFGAFGFASPDYTAIGFTR